jgi:hypothetical protein
LQVWRVKPPHAAAFRTEVWKRIERQRGSAWQQVLRTPAVGVPAAMVLAVLLSGWIGHAVGSAQARADREVLVASYAARLDARVQSGLGESDR